MEKVTFDIAYKSLRSLDTVFEKGMRNDEKEIVKQSADILFSYTSFVSD